MSICDRAPTLGSQSAAAFRHSQTVEAASFRRALFTPGADEFLGAPHALAAQMRPQTAQKMPGKLRGS